MKITIDTSTDSHDHIKKTIEFLSKLVEHHAIESDSGSHVGVFDLPGLQQPSEAQKNEPVSGGLFGMFNEPPPEEQEPQDDEEETVEEEKEEKPITSVFDLETY